jgi:hypothetical protein
MNKNMIELLELNHRLASLQAEFLERVAKSGFFSADLWLEEKKISDLDEIVFLRKYLREINKRFVRFCIKDGYAAYWKPNQLGREHLCRKLKLADIELTNIIKNKRGEQ